MFLELIIVECNRGLALSNVDTASESEDEPPCKVPTLFAVYSKVHQKLSREKNVTLMGKLGKLLRFDYSYQYKLYQHFNILVHKFCKISLFFLQIGY